jgi:DNA-binding transcriptional MerR regulator
VSAIRFYADEGVVTPTGLTEGGFQQYDVDAIARLELVRTLHDLAVTHLRLGDDQLRQFRARRAVLRTIVRQHTTTEQVSLMRKLVSMSDDDRDRLVDRFWDFVTDGLDRTRRDRAGRGVPHGGAGFLPPHLRHRAGRVTSPSSTGTARRRSGGPRRPD